MVSEVIFTLFVLLLAGQRLLELKKSERHRHHLLALGGREHGAGHFPAMALIHATWLIAMVAEVWWSKRPVYWPATITAAAFFILGQLLRLWAMRDLGNRWCARIITLPNCSAITGGIYRFIRHPNYVGVVIEIAAAPMLHTAYVTAFVFTLLNALLLKVRIKEEEHALEQDNRYWASFAALSKDPQ